MKNVMISPSYVTAEQFVPVKVTMRAGNKVLEQVAETQEDLDALMVAGYQLPPQNSGADHATVLKDVAKKRTPKEIDSRQYGAVMAQAVEMGLSGGALAVDSKLAKAMKDAKEDEREYVAKTKDAKITLRPSANGGVYGSIAFTFTADGRTIKGNVIAPRGHEGHEAGQQFNLKVIDGDRGFRYEAEF